MKKLPPLLLCLSISFFTLARVTESVHTPAAGAKTAHKPTGRKAVSFDMSDAEQEEVAGEEDSDAEVSSDDEGENMNDDDGGDGDAGDEGITDDDGGNDGAVENGRGDDSSDNEGD